MRHCGQTPDLRVGPQATRPRPRFTWRSQRLRAPDPRPGPARGAEVHAPNQTSIQPPSQRPRHLGNGEIPVGPR
eukprot:3905276-Pyramimonas_sp.AAC.1